MLLQDRSHLFLETGKLGVVLQERLGFGIDGVAPTGNRLEHVQVDGEVGCPPGRLSVEVGACGLPRLFECLVLLVVLRQVAIVLGQKVRGVVKCLLQVRPIAHQKQLPLAERRAGLPQPQWEGNIDAELPAGELPCLGREPPAVRRPPCQAIPAIKRRCIHFREGLIAGRQELLLIGLDDQLQFDEIGAILFSGSQDRVPFDSDPALGRRGDGHDLRPVGGGQTQNVPQCRFAPQHIRLGRDQVGPETGQRGSSLRPLARVAQLVPETGIGKVKGPLALLHLLPTRPDVGSGKHQCPVAVYHATNQLLDAPFELIERPFRIDSGNLDRGQVRPMAGTFQQRLLEAQIDRARRLRIQLVPPCAPQMIGIHAQTGRSTRDRAFRQAQTHAVAIVTIPVDCGWDAGYPRNLVPVERVQHL